MQEKIIRTENLAVYFFQKHKQVKALDGVDVFLQRGLTTALAGESGCGKTTLAKAILGFHKPRQGRIFLRQDDITLRKNYPLLRKNIQIVFQNPFSSLDPRFTVFDSLFEALSVFTRIGRRAAQAIIADKLKEVELSPDIMNRYPHELSGGQNQRVCIARSLIHNPPVVILDEPTSSLDVTTASKIIKLLMALQEKHGLTYLFISHNLKLLRKISHYCFIMYRGKIMEQASRDALYGNPCHPYTKLLQEASNHTIKSLPEEAEVFLGCPFRPRCSQSHEACKKYPRAIEVEPGHFVHCHLFT